jgi:effector-binding domain-containing protein
MTTTPMSTTETPKLDSMEVAVPAAVVAQCRASCAAEPAAIGTAVGAAFQKIDAFVKASAIATCGAPRVVYTEWSPNGVQFTAAVPVRDVPRGVVDTADVSIASVPECTALRFVHRGPYREIRNTYDRIEAWLRERGGIRTAADWARYSPMWEEYLNDPATTREPDLVTRIYLTLR